MQLSIESHIFMIMKTQQIGINIRHQENMQTLIAIKFISQ